jgi:hypothetical protein
MPFLAVKLGAFGDHAELAAALHGYVASAPPWHTIPDDLPTAAVE